MDHPQIHGQGDGILDQALPPPRLLIDVISDHAKNQPQKIWGSLPEDTSDPAKGYKDITFARLVYAVDRAARWLHSTVQETERYGSETLAYLGPPDSRYIIFVLASIKAGCQMLFLSPRNSDEAQYHVMREAKCTKILCAESMRKRVAALIQNSVPKEDRDGNTNGRSEVEIHDTRVFIVPEQRDLLEDRPEPPYPYGKTLQEARYDPLVTLHTSSTTGMPKIIPLTQGWGMHEDIVQHIPKHNGLDIITRKPFYGKVRMFCALPLFHAGGILLTLLKSLYHDIVAVFQPSAVPLSATVFDGILRYGKCNGCVIPPSLLEEILAEPAFFDTVANLKFVQFGSGPLAKAAGDTLLTRQNDCPHYIGSTEIALPPLLELDDPVSEWQYFRFHPWSGVDMRPVGEQKGLFEMFVKRNGMTTPGLQPVFELFPDIKEWPTRDLYSQHPTKPYLFKSAGRSDDVIVLSNGEKLNPVDTESSIANAVPGVVAAIVFGQARFMPGILLEIRGIDVQSAEKRKQLIEEIWPFIEKANLNAPKHGQLSKSSILFTSPNKPFARTPKLSVRRGPTLELYVDEISQMYDRLEADLEATNDIDLVDVDLASKESVWNLVQHLILQVTGWSEIVQGHDDLFVLGFDSLHVSRVSRAIKLILTRHSATNAQLMQINTRIIYSNPTINLLAKYVHALANETSASSQANGAVSREQNIESLISKYSDFGFDTSAFSGGKRWRIILTGSTGSLGTYLLTVFLRDPRVDTVFCINRASNARSRQFELFNIQGLSIPSKDLDKKVQFLHSESLAAPFLGLDEKTYHDILLAHPTHIIHNAWPVNFNLSIASFEPHIAGVRSLIDLCASFDRSSTPKFFFVSSLSSVTGLPQKPEAIAFDTSVPSHMGYGESKYVSERVLNAATIASEGAIETTVLRVGQIAGPVGQLHKHEIGEYAGKGIWPMREWLPSIIVSSLTVAAIPETLGRMEAIEWIPVDFLAQIIAELMQDEVEKKDATETNLKVGENCSNGHGETASSEAVVYNLINPKAVTWNQDILPVVKSNLNIKTTLPLSQWIQAVCDGPDEMDTSRPNPARKILPFYEALVVGSDYDSPSKSAFVTAGAARDSTTFRALEPVKKEWMETWIGQWKLHPLNG